MDNNFTDINIVLDRSGSMGSVWDDTIGGFNAFLAAQRSEGTGKARVTLTQFDHVCETVYAGRALAEAPELTRMSYVPRGSTALLDAMGSVIVSTGARLAAMPEARRPGKMLFVVVTDGQENSSTEYSKDRVFDMIRTQREVYKWDFVFLGANQDAIAAGADLGGLAAGKSMGYAASAAGTAGAWSSISSYVTRTRSSATAADALVGNAFSDAERTASTGTGTGTGAQAPK